MIQNSKQNIVRSDPKKIGVISFTKKGSILAEELGRLLSKYQIEIYVGQAQISDWIREQFVHGANLIFIGACGIAVRMIAPYVKDKLKDPAVIVIDEMGHYVIPILSGHVGGGNELACEISDLISGQPVITTATDVHGLFTVDVFARKNRLYICNRQGIKEVSKKLLETGKISYAISECGSIKGKRIDGLEERTFPVSSSVDFIISPYFVKEKYLLALCPKVICIGIGCKANKPKADIAAFVIRLCEKYKIRMEAIQGVFSIDKKKDEPGLIGFCEVYGLPFITYSAQDLQKLSGADFHTSKFVKDTVGVDNVCERAGFCGGGQKGEWVIRKTVENGMTLAAFEREWSVDFEK